MRSGGNKRIKKLNFKKFEDRANVFFVLLMVASILGLILSVIGFRKAVEVVHMDHLRESSQKSAQYRLIHANTLLNNLVDDLDAAANSIVKFEDVEDPMVLKILQYSNHTSQFSFMGVADAEGNGYDDKGYKVDVSDRDYFQSAMKGQVAFSEVMESKVFPGEMVQVIAHPIRGEGNVVRGIVYGVLHLNDIAKLTIQAEGEMEDAIYVVDSCGKYITQFRNNRVVVSDENFWEDLENSSLTEEEISRMKSDFEERRAGGIFYTYGDARRYACYIPIGPNKWQLVYSVSTDATEDMIHSLYDMDNREALSAAICYVLLITAIIWHFKRANREIQKAHRDAVRNLGYMRIALDHSKDIVFEYAQNLNILQLKNDFRNLLFDRSTILGIPESILSKNVIAPESVQVFKNLFKTIKTERSCKGEIRILNDGDEIWYRITMNNVYNDKDERIDTVGIVEDISLQKQHEAEAKKRFQFQKTLIANALEYGMVDLKTDTILEWNGKDLCLPYQEYVTLTLQKFASEESIPYVEKVLSLENLRTEYNKGREFVEVQYQKKYGDTLRWVSVMVYRLYMDDSSKVLCVVTDIDGWKRKEILLKKQAERDGLTGLYNAMTTRTKINEVLALEHQNDEKQVFVLIDLDNFKQINDTFGHSYGDKVLMDVAETLSARFRSSDIMGRIGGDEFVLLLRDVKSYDYAQRLIENLCTLLHRTYQEGDISVTVSASIGLASAPQDGKNFQELYEKADAAQYQVKKHSKNGCKRYEAEPDQDTES